MKGRKVQSIELFGPPPTPDPAPLAPPKECPELRRCPSPHLVCAPGNDAGATGDRGLYLFFFVSLFFLCALDAPRCAGARELANLRPANLSASSVSVSARLVPSYLSLSLDPLPVRYGNLVSTVVPLSPREQFYQLNPPPAPSLSRSVTPL